jgi:endoglucanase
MEKFCAQNEAISDNSDVFIGFVAWGAGSFEDDYILNLSPSGSPGDYSDNKLMKQCVIKPFIEDGGPLTTTASSPKTKTKSISTKTKSADETTTATMAENSAKSTDRVFKEEDPSSSSASATETSASKASSTADNAGCSRSVQSLTGGLMLGAALFFLCV